MRKQKVKIEKLLFDLLAFPILNKVDLKFKCGEMQNNSHWILITELLYLTIFQLFIYHCVVLHNKMIVSFSLCQEN